MTLIVRRTGRGRRSFGRDARPFCVSWIKPACYSAGFFHVKRELYVLRFGPEQRKIKQPFMGERDDAVHRDPFWAIRWEPRIGNGDVEFARGGGVLVDEREAVEQRSFGKRNDENCVPFLQVAVDCIIGRQ